MTRRRVSRLARITGGVIGAVVLLTACQTGNTSTGGGGGVACASGVKTTKVVIVGSIPTDPFEAAVKNGADQAAKDFCVNYQFLEPAHNTFPEEIAAGETAIGGHPDGMGVVYFDKSFQKLTTDALDAGIKVVFYNNQWWGDADNKYTDSRLFDLAYVGQNERTSGITLANSFIKLLKPNSTVLIINPFPQAYVLTVRHDGVASVLDANHIPYETLNMDGTGDEGKYLSIIGPYLESHKEINAIVGCGNPGANPAANYVQAHNLTYPIGTFDTGAEATGYLQKGTISMAINQQPYLQGYYTVMELALWTKFGLRPADINTGTFLVTKDNVNDVQTLLKEGKG